jgi:hypothetical protein
VTRKEENEISYYGKSPFVADSHAEKERIAKPASTPKTSAFARPQGYGRAGGR